MIITGICVGNTSIILDNFVGFIWFAYNYITYTDLLLLMNFKTVIQKLHATHKEIQESTKSHSANTRKYT